MGTAEYQQQASIYAEEIARGADSEILAEIGFRAPEILPSSPADMLAREAVAEEVEAVGDSTAAPPSEAASEAEPDMGWQHEAHAEYLERQERVTPTRPKAQRPARTRRTPRLSGRARVLADGRGTDPDLM